MNRINPNHKQQNSALKVIGPIVLMIGLIFTAIGMVSFFSAFGNSSGPPRLFWCAIIGLPITGVGVGICKFAFMGKIARYSAGELAPVTKDTFNYMAKETQEGVTDITKAVTNITKTSKPASQSSSLTIEQRIKKLEKMKLSGLINEEDFEEQKDRILSEI